MTPERRQQIRQIFERAQDYEPGQRSGYLAEACAGDAALLSEIESLLASHQESQKSWLFEEPPDTLTGTRISAYEVLRQIGHGGMGVVYLAARSDDQYQQRVAIKVVKRGMDTDFILSRFRNERQILASLDHPNIARLLDGGMTSDGRPYFVMEYIEGKPLDEYCDTHQLSITQRLMLFQQVCAAVHYAHQNLVVHRDIKPSNILVTSEGTPKLLDFGIAKIVHPADADETLETLTAQRVMTPEYASPEQARGEPITTATDVYLLGVLLYELLTGHRPHRFTSRLPEEVAKVICEKDPQKPSTVVAREALIQRGDEPAKLTPEMVSRTREGRPEKLRRRLSGDLDNIVLKSLNKEPQRRYASVEQFSEDIRRHLAGLPVIARKDTLGYRTAKFIGRHKAGVSVAILLIATLVSGILSTLWQARVARAERARAERRFGDVRKLANSFMFEIHDAIENLPGSTKPRELLVKRALEYLDSLAQEAGDDLTLQHELATSYLKVGDVQGYPLGANLGDTPGALASYRKALVLCESLAATTPGDPSFRKDLLISHERIGDTLIATGETAKALEQHRKALEISKTLFSADPSDQARRRTLGISYIKLGEALTANGDTPQALEAFRKALDLAEVPASDAASPAARRLIAVICVKLGELLTETGDFPSALANYRKALELREHLAREDSTNAQAKRDVAASYEKLAAVMANTGDISGGLDYQRRSMKIDEVLAAADPANVDAQLDLAISRSNIAELLSLSGKSSEAQESYRKALVILEALARTNPSNTEIRFTLADDTIKIGHCFMNNGEIVTADRHYQQGVAILQGLVTADPSNAEFRGALAASYQKVGEAHVRTAARGKIFRGTQMELWRAARSWYQKSLEVWLSLQRQGVSSKSQAEALATVEKEITKCEAALGKQDRVGAVARSPH
jgi:non-specific serine/threonine protein kinase/serine/threonine-protein kinase